MLFSITSVESKVFSCAKVLIDSMLISDNTAKNNDIIFFKINTSYLIVLANSTVSSKSNGIFMK